MSGTTIQIDPLTLEFDRFVAMLRWIIANPPAVSPFGTVSGPGNQGSSNSAHLAGHAGTGADRRSVPRQLKQGSSWIYVP